MTPEVLTAPPRRQFAEDLIDAPVNEVIDTMRRNWPTLQHAHQLITEPMGGNA